VDEFASLVEEVPDFVNGVVGIGMRGRSLGVHVVLATQRPAGVVSADIRANVNLRVCLRVTAASESNDVIDVPDATRIAKRTPGRAYLRTGHQELTLFQAARVGWPRAAAPGPAGNADPQAEQAERAVARAREVTTLGEPAERPGGDGDLPAGADGETDLTVTVEAIAKAATASGHEPPAPPWLPPLPPLVPLPPTPAGPPGRRAAGPPGRPPPRRSRATSWRSRSTPGTALTCGSASARGGAWRCCAPRRRMPPPTAATTWCPTTSRPWRRRC
jgi:S-DNA-T family DNA segregation ATPase FtsK/SpoIIIE